MRQLGKTTRRLLQAGIAFLGFTTASVLAVEEASVQIDVKKEEPVPVYYSAVVNHEAVIEEEKMTHRASISVKLIQGEAETFSFSLMGVGEIVSVTGKGDTLLSWATRREEHGSFLDLTVKPSAEAETKINDYEFEVKVEEEIESLPTEALLWNLGSGDAVGFKAEVRVSVAQGVVAEFDSLVGHVPVRKDEEKRGWQSLLGAGPVSRKLVSASGGEILLRLRKDGVPKEKFEIVGASLTGGIDEDSEAAAFVLRGELIAHEDEVELPLLGGAAAVSELPQIEGLRFFVRDAMYFVQAEKAGRYNLALSFVAKVFRESEKTRLYFTTPSTTVLPVDLVGLQDVEFLDEYAVRPVFKDWAWQGYVPTSGRVSLGWRKAIEEEDDALFFSSEGLVDIEVGAGLLRQDSYLGLQVLQGELPELFLALDGAGEILAVEGDDVLSWERNEQGLQIQFRTPVSKSARLLVRSQIPLDAFPVQSESLQLSPEGTVRHAGYLRVRNAGAVRLEASVVEGLMQLAPEEFPGRSVEARQQFVYRFPASEYSLSIEADQITPEVSVSETLVYELGESDRGIKAEVELDIREASLREWEMTVPADYSVVSVSGASVGDYVVATEENEGERVLRVIFADEVSGRQLVSLDLEKNEPMEEGGWDLPRLRHPAAKALRGEVGVVGSPGFRVSIEEVEKLAEKPLSFFPKKLDGLQLAFQIRERDWTALLQVERLPRSVEADVFHLYSLKDGTAFGSVLVNYFITGSPVSEWKLRVPEDAGNVSIDGQNVRTWRREGNEVTVTLQQPVSGLYTLLLTCEETVGLQGGKVAPGRVEILNVRGERGFVQVVSPVQVRSEVSEVSEGLLKLDPLELPAGLRLSSSAPSLAVYQYTERPFELEMDVEWFEPGETVAQVVEFAEAKSRISRDGEVVSDVIYSVKTRGGRVLRLTLPEKVRLWEVRVNGEAVNARVNEEATLIPLPAGADANETVEVKVRYGQAADRADRPKLYLPAVAVPILKTDWKIQGDERRSLVLDGQEELPVEAGLSGFDWVAGPGLEETVAVVALLLFGAGLLRVQRFLGAFALLGSLAVLVVLLNASWPAMLVEPGASVIEKSVPVLAPGEVVEAEVGNYEKKKFNWEQSVIVTLAGGLLWAVIGYLGRRRWQLFTGVLAAGGACLWMQGGAFMFYGLFAMMVVALIVALFKGGAKTPDKPQPDEPKSEKKDDSEDSSESDDSEGPAGPEEPSNGGGGSGPIAATVGLLLAGMLGLTAPVEADTLSAGDSLRQSWKISEERISAAGEFTLRGEVGDDFFFLNSEVTLRDFEGAGVRLSSDSNGYVVTILADDEQAGGEGDELVSRTFSFSYEVLLKDNTVAIPTGQAAVNSLEVELDKVGWTFSCSTAAQVEELEVEGASKARLILLPRGASKLEMKPRERDPSKEETAYFVEVSNAYVPGLGLLEGRHLVDVKPSRGVVRQLKMLVPEGLAVSGVSDGPVANWRFSADSQELVVDLSQPQSEDFSLFVLTQKSLGSLPLELEIEPMRVLGGERELGTLGLAFRGEAQAERIEEQGLIEVNLSDFPAELLKKNSEVLHRSYRYGAEEASVQLRMVPVAAEVRVVSEELLSLGMERTLLKASMKVDITRAGIFRFSFVVPEGFEVESLSGAAMSHWNESGEEEKTVTVHLKGQTLGSHDFALVLSKAGLLSEQLDEAEEEEAWSVPRLTIQEAARQTGQLVVRAEQGLRLRSLNRRNVSEIDPRAAGSFSKKGAALAFRLLQKDWEIDLGIESLDPWVTGQVLQEVTLREGQTRNLALLSLKVENASIRQVQVRFPGLDEEMAKTLRASGAAVSGISPVEGEDGLWVIDFKRRVVGSHQVRLEWEYTGERAQGVEVVQSLRFPGLRQVSSYAALRAGAQLEVTLADLAEGWYRLDWMAVPSELRDAGAGGIPAVALRVGDAPLRVSVTRHAVAEALKLRVSQGTLTTVVSPLGDLLTAAKLRLEVIQRSTLRIAFEPEAELFSVFVNGESVGVVRDDAGYLFYVVPGSEGDYAEVEFVYAVDGKKADSFSLQAPEISVPLENMEWRVVVPEGFELGQSVGDLELEEERGRKVFDKKSYLKSIADRKVTEKKKAESTFLQADSALEVGKNGIAVQLLQNVANNSFIDLATNEDARVKLNRVQTDQIVAGLNSRRQRLYLDNQSEEPGGFRNSQLERAAIGNTILRGEVDFRPDELNQFLQGNSREENDFLRQIAERLLTHQKATEPAPQAISVPVPEEGRVFVFRRSVRVDEGKPMKLSMNLQKQLVVAWPRLILAGLLLLVGSAGLSFSLRKK